MIRISGLQCLVEIEGRDWSCEIRGRMKAGRRTSNSPVIVGDWVEVEETGKGAGVVEAVHPRTSKFSRQATGQRNYEQIVAVNLDQLVVVVAARQPAPRVGFVDRAIVQALHGDLVPVICFNKVDLDPQGAIRPVAEIYRRLGYTTCLSSALTREGVDAFRCLLAGKVSAVVGQSGVGKSSLLNCLDPELSIRTQELMSQHDRGRHTTAAVQLYRLAGGGYLADTPGIKELRLWGVDRTNLVDYFVEMKPLADNCHFSDCAHLGEPGCAVRQAVEEGLIAPLRYEGYRRIMESLEQGS